MHKAITLQHLKSRVWRTCKAISFPS